MKENKEIAGRKCGNRWTLFLGKKGTDEEGVKMRSAWVDQLVERLTLDFGSSHDLTVCEFEPHMGL